MAASSHLPVALFAGDQLTALGTRVLGDLGRSIYTCMIGREWRFLLTVNLNAQLSQVVRVFIDRFLDSLKNFRTVDFRF
jgi:hypothetical protein